MPTTHFKGLVTVPKGMVFPEELTLPELVIRDEDAQQLFRSFKSMFADRLGFSMTLSFKGDERPLTIRFTHVGVTAAFFMLSYDVNDEPQHVHGLTALLARRNPDEDRQAIEHVRKYAALRGIDRKAFEDALTNDAPVAASFFADIGSASWPPLHTIIRILSAAFFDQFGIGDSAVGQGGR
jgi:hypothetical protein